MSTRFFTNGQQNTLLKKFEGVFTNNRDIQFPEIILSESFTMEKS